MRYYFVLILFFTIKISAQEHWNCHIIDNIGNGADGVKFADINNDKLVDIVTGWEESGLTKLYLQPAVLETTKSWPKLTLGKTPKVEDAVFADMNNDGWLDVVSCTENNAQKIFVFFNQNTKYLDKANWEQKVLPASVGLMSWMYAEPMQIDNNNGCDLIAAGKGKNAALGWFEAPKDSGNLKDWYWHEISKVGWVMSILKEDMDKDGDLDILITDRNGNLRGCRWLENPGSYKLQVKPWNNHFIGGMSKEVMFMDKADFNGDGKKEILVAERTSNTILVFIQEQSSWKKQSIKLPQNTGRAKSVKVGDLDKDGIQDIVVSTNTLGENKDGLIFLGGKHITNAKESHWQSISGVHKAKYDKVELLDLDMDGDLDVVICEENFGEKSEGLGLVWYENPYY